MKYEIIVITDQNKDVLNHVAADVFDDEIKPSFLNAYLAQPHHQMVVAVADGVVVGQARAIVHFQPDEQQHLYIDNLGVAPSAKRNGVATSLFEALINWGRQKGCHSYWLATEIDNEEANGFYKKFGLKPQKMNYYERD